MKKILPIVLLFLIALPGFSQVQTSWTNTFTINVFRQALPAIPTNTLTLTVVSGDTNTVSGEVFLANNGNLPIDYTITMSLDGTITDYTTQVKGHSAGWVSFQPMFDAGLDTNTQFASWSGDNTATMDIGFNFPFYGSAYTTFSAGIHGGIALGGATLPENPYAAFSYDIPLFDKLIHTNPNDPWGTFNVTTAPIIAPFWGSLSISTNNVRYKKESDRLIVSWQGAKNELGGSTNLQFQTQLYDNGKMIFLYKNSGYGDVGDALVGIQDSSSSKNLTPPQQAEYQILLDPTYWVTMNSTDGTLPGASSQPIIFTANGANQSAGTETFDITVSWADGSTNTITLTVITQAPTYTLNAPSTPSFTGLENDITQTNITFSNTGNAALSYTITDTDARGAGYTWGRTEFDWIDGSRMDTYEISLNPVADEMDILDEGISGLLPIGFDFPFYGAIYTNLCIGVNGGISLGEARPMYTYQSWIYYDYRENREWMIWSGNYSVNGEVVYSGVMNPYYFNDLSTTTQPAVPSQNNFIALTEQYATVDAPVRPQFIAPYWADLLFDSNSSVQVAGDDTKLVITWKNLKQFGKQKIQYFSWNSFTQSGSGSDGRPTVANDLTFQAILHKDGTIVYQYQSLENSVAWTNAIIGIRDTASRTLPGSLAYAGDAENDGTIFTVTNYVVTTNGFYPLYPGGPDSDIPIIVTNEIVTTEYAETITGEALMFSPANDSAISVLPKSGVLQPGESNPWVKLIGDARNLSAGYSETAHYSIEHSGGSKTMNATFNVTGASGDQLKDSDGDGQADSVERRQGTDAFNPDSVFDTNLDGSRTLSWTAPEGEYAGSEYDRVYTIEYTTNLVSEWIWLDAVTNETTYTDDINIDVPQIFYKITVDW